MAPVHHLISRQALLTPEATAVTFKEEHLSYRLLDERANQFAHALLGRGLGRGDLVAIQMERGPALLVALLGVMKAGAAYVPVDPASPASRRDFVLGESGAGLLVVDSTSAAPDTPAAPVGVPVLDLARAEALAHRPTSAPDVAVSADDAVYVLYTSGTTGNPKGVVLEHGGISNLLDWMARAYSFTGADRVLQKTPYTFDASVWELYLPLVTGGTVVLAEPGGHQDPQYLAQAVRDHDITTLQLVPSMLRLVLDEPALRAARSLRHVFSGGEALPRELQERCHAALPVPLHNLYGPTETSVQVLTWTCRPDETRDFVPIGLPVDNVTALVLDPAGAPVPTGQVGELHIGGVAVARGYLANPERTTERFATRQDEAGRTLRTYRTGDLVRQHPDGVFEFLGRVDDQIKIQGYRVELGEIETHLRGLPGVRDAAVVAEPNPLAGGDRLAAYLAADPAGLDVRELREHLAARLPAYMVPAVFRTLPSFPLSAHGKLDRAALARASAVELTAGPTGRAARNETEQRLLELWAEVLAVPSVGVDDDFFELGGNSMAGLLMIAKAKKLGIVIKPTELFRLRRIDAIVSARG
ncbi:amino acid adenylation domain-containing protein [Streptacidiphilus jiangxiensis]|uniref:Amino acid adenylation domain-containing protein n=1 Tax=Streptacidiphilus jiangxiensis TaxID=235985 RepID=A0A1H7VMB6_STRJI|nr:amino acid adenylation domain-containing protein [Streptacidiphilus jiangxiensis]SEM10300.1 amino acid adenylation domain-containing protein [Streptacidiphilus jiangxiensis]